MRVHTTTRPGGPARFATAALLALLALLAGACAHDDTEMEARMLTGGDPALGRRAIKQYGCASCHTIPGIPGANSLVGPPLTGISQRAYIGGVLPNTPDNMMTWILNPQLVSPKTAMPITGVSVEEARHITAYLYTLR